MAISIGSSLKKAAGTVPYTVDDQELKGGFRCVADIAARDAIPIAARRAGMIVRIPVSGTDFQDWTLPTDSLANAAWVQVSAPGGVGGVDGYIPTAGGQLTGELEVTSDGSISIAANVTIANEGEDTVIRNVSELHGLVFKNTLGETTIEFDIETGQIVAKAEVALASDQTLKQNINTIAKSLSITSKLRGVTFDWSDSGKHSMGLIAQEVKAVLPFLVHESADGKLSVLYTALIGLLVENIKELSSVVEKQADDIAKIKQALNMET